MERLFKNMTENEPTLDPVLVETLNQIEAAKLMLNDRADELSDRHDRLGANLDVLRSWLESAAAKGEAERFKTLESATQAVLARMKGLRGTMESVIAEIDAIDEHLGALVRLPTPINE